MTLDPRVTVVIPFDRYTPDLAGLAAQLAVDPFHDRAIFLEYSGRDDEGHRAARTAFDLYLIGLGGLASARADLRHEPGASLSDAWNLGPVLAQHHAIWAPGDDVGGADAPWVLVILDPGVLLTPGTVGALVYAVTEGNALLAYPDQSLPARPDCPPTIVLEDADIDPGALFDGMAFAYASSGLTLCQDDHDTPAAAAVDLTARLELDDAAPVRLAGLGITYTRKAHQ